VTSSPAAANSVSPPAVAGHQDTRPILLFDGVCNLCHRSVQFILEHERGPTLAFASLQSETARRLLTAHGLPADHLRSMVLIEQGRSLTDSDAAIAIARHLRAPWRWGVVGRILPRALRNWSYHQIAARRYRWFGRRADAEACLLPTPELRGRFLV
jgi:predicted DCC family thiol-disulfide oxidoreductase YuxK